MQSFPLDILFEDHHLIAVNKPAGLPTQAPPGFPSIEAQVKAFIKEKYNKPAGVYLGIPHRLDRPVSGVILFARNTKAAARVAEQFSQHIVTKVYWGWVHGNVVEDAGEWHDYLRKIPDVAKAEVAEATADQAREAITPFTVLQRLENRTLLEFVPKTGRMHQLRVQAASRGHPIVGDSIYGSVQKSEPAPEPAIPMIALHARSLTLVHPFSKEPLRIEAPAPEEWNLLLTDTSIA
jgi:23S rRNA pseudouridine1911/1915/1917 synthase